MKILRRGNSVVPPIILLSAVLSILALGRAEETGYEGKELPDKGDSECLSLAERYEMFLNGQGDPAAWLTFCDRDPDPAPPTVVAENGIALQFYASLPAFSSDFGMSNNAICF